MRENRFPVVVDHGSLRPRVRQGFAPRRSEKSRFHFAAKTPFFQATKDFLDSLLVESVPVLLLNCEDISPVYRMKMVTAALAAFMLLAPMSATAQAPLRREGEVLYDRLCRELSCLCGCNQTVKACPHTNCDSAVPTRSKIRELIGQGKNHDEITALFVKEKGEIILSQPRKEGFNLVGYILPSVAIIVVGGLIFKLIKGWTRSGAVVAPQTAARKESADGAGGSLAERMKKELSEFED